MDVSEARIQICMIITLIFAVKELLRKPARFKHQPFRIHMTTSFIFSFSAPVSNTSQVAPDLSQCA